MIERQDVDFVQVMGSVGNNQLTINSREVSEMVKKRHSDLLRDIETYLKYLENAELRSQEFFIEGTYKSQGNNRTYKCYDITRKGCEFVANKLTGQKGTIFTATYINKFHDMEKDLQKQNTVPKIDSKFMFQIAQQLEEKEKQIQTMKPKALFADAVATSKSSVLVGELAKILKQNNINIGQNRMFEWLRSNGYLMSRKGESWNMPTQKSMDLELFEIKVRTINNADGSIRTTKTPKVTGKGQIYFVNKFNDLQQLRIVNI